MKTTNYFMRIIVIASLCITTIVHAQVKLYGLTSQGGTGYGGTLFSVIPAGNVNVVSNLQPAFASVPYGSPFYASDGNFYASSADGGYHDSCTIFKCTPNGVLTTMINLDSVWGSSSPQGNSLMQATDGNLYGMTTIGGPYYDGVIFKLSLSGQYVAIHFFDSGAFMPFGSLIQTADGNLWGMTSRGGTYGYGAIFKCTTSGAFTVMHSFSLLEGAMPNGDLLLANDGSFYGLTSSGGTNNYGTLFRYNPSDGFTKLVDFDYDQGAYPDGSLIQASDGNLYGLTSVGGIEPDSEVYGQGTLFTCTLSGNLSTVYVFYDSNGLSPMGTLMQASDGNIYGMTNNGGKYHAGTIFKYPLGGTLTKIADFNDTVTGGYPEYGKLIEVDGLQGINEANAETGNIKVFPNPSNGVFQIQANSQQLMANSHIEVYNMLGEKIANSQWPSANSQMQIDLSNQAPGIYLYRVITETGEMIGTGKLVIER